MCRGGRAISISRCGGPAPDAESENQKNKVLPPPPGCHHARARKGRRSDLFCATSADTSPGWGDRMNILVKKRARPAHGSASAAKVRRGAPGCHHRRRSCQKLLFPPRQMCGGGQRLEEAGGKGTILKVRSVSLSADGLLMTQRESRQNGRMVEERRSP